MLAGALPLGDAITVDSPMTIGEVSPETLKFGTHFSRASPTNSGDGLECFSRPQKNTLRGGRPSATAQPWQMSATGTSFILEHSSRLQSPLSLRRARHVQQPWRLHFSRRSLVVSWKNSRHSHSLCFSCPLIRHDQRDTLTPWGAPEFLPCLDAPLPPCPWGVCFCPWGLLLTALAAGTGGLEGLDGDRLPSRAAWFTLAFGLDTGSFPGILACTSAVKYASWIRLSSFSRYSEPSTFHVVTPSLTNILLHSSWIDLGRTSATCMRKVLDSR